jgi:hypothetical protein
LLFAAHSLRSRCDCARIAGSTPWPVSPPWRAGGVSGKPRTGTGRSWYSAACFPVAPSLRPGCMGTLDPRRSRTGLASHRSCAGASNLPGSPSVPMAWPVALVELLLLPQAEHCACVSETSLIRASSYSRGLRRGRRLRWRHCRWCRGHHGHVHGL